MRIRFGEVWTLNDSTQASELCVTDCVVLKLESSTHVAVVWPEADQQCMITCLQDTRTIVSITESSKRFGSLSSSSIKHLHEIISTPWERWNYWLFKIFQDITWARLHVNISDDDMNSWSSPHHDPPGTLSIVMIWLRIVWRADATTRCCQITSTSWNIFVDNNVSCLNLILLLYLVTREQIWQFPSFVCFKQRLLATSELNSEPRNKNISPGCDENISTVLKEKYLTFILLPVAVPSQMMLNPPPYLELSDLNFR